MAQEVVNQHAGLIRFDPACREGCRVHIQLQTQPRLLTEQRPYAHG